MFPVVTVPKFAVAKHRYFLPLKHDIRLPRNCFDILSVSESPSPEFFSKFNFNLGVFVFNLTHIETDLLFCLYHSSHYLKGIPVIPLKIAPKHRLADDSKHAVFYHFRFRQTIDHAFEAIRRNLNLIPLFCFHAPDVLNKY